MRCWSRWPFLVVALTFWAQDLSAQAYRVKDINPGSGDGVDFFGSTFDGCCIGDAAGAIGDVLYFAADNGTLGMELWRTDGTDAGTVLIKDINPGPNASGPRNLTPVGNIVYFRADDGVHGYELWKTDGTAAGTVLVKDIRPGPAHALDMWHYDYKMFSPVSLSSQLFFIANDGIHGYEMWKSDGTGPGTVLVKDLEPGLGNAALKFLYPFDGSIYFSAYFGPGQGGLWRSDGTDPGTTLVRGFASDQPNYLTAFGGALYFAADDGTGLWGLWKTDGTTPGTVLVEGGLGISGWIQVANESMFFSASGGLGGASPWISDGTEEGTRLLKHINPGMGSVSRFAGFSGHTFFAATDLVVGHEMWITDGTTDGTILLKDIGPGPSLDGLGAKTLTAGDCSVYFLANSQLWTSDGTSEGTVQYPMAAFKPTPVIRVGRLLYLEAMDGGGRELWALDVEQGCPTLAFASASSISPEAVGVHTVNVTLTTSDGQPTTRPATVDYETADGSAVAVLDYTPTTGTLTFPTASPSGTTLPIHVPISSDTLDEIDETLRLEVSLPVGGKLGALAEHTVTIADDDVTPLMAIGDVAMPEGETGSTPFTFTIGLSQASSLVVTARYQTTAGTASEGVDYQPATGTMVFPPGTTTRTISVPVAGDRVHEDAETFTVDLSFAQNAIAIDGQGDGTILDDDAVGLSVADLTIVEPESGTRVASFTVTLSPASASPVTVEYETSDVTATSAIDYQAASGLLTFNPGTATMPLDVTVHSDALVEGAESFEVNLSNPSGAAIAYANAAGSLYDPGNLFTVAPCRLLDTRVAPASPLTAGGTRIVSVGGSCGVPPSARAVSVNLTVVQPTVTGNLRLFPEGAPLPVVSSLNYSGGQTRGNNALARLGSTGALSIYCAQASGTAHVIVDVTGYFE